MMLDSTCNVGEMVWKGMFPVILVSENGIGVMQGDRSSGSYKVGEEHWLILG